jgi:hypothetical protein
MIHWQLQNSDERILVTIAEIGKNLSTPGMDSRETLSNGGQ